MSIPDDFKFDSRVRNRLMRKQVLSTAEVNRHLDALPDLEGEYEVMSEVPQPAVTPARSEVKEEPIVFDGIRRLQALSDASSSPVRAAPPPAPSAPSAPAYREPEARPLGTPLRSLMETEISGVGVGAVAALGAMAAEERNSGTFGHSSLGSPFAPQPAASPFASPFAAPPPVITPPAAPATPAAAQPAPASEPEPPTGPTPQTLRSEGSPAPAAASDEPATAGLDAAEDDDDIEDEADDDDDEAEDDVDDEADAEADDDEIEDEADDGDDDDAEGDDDDDDDDAEGDADEEEELG